MEILAHSRLAALLAAAILSNSSATKPTDVVAYPDGTTERGFAEAPTRIVINIPERVLRVYRVEGAIDDFTPVDQQFPVAVGQKAWPTPVMDAAIAAKTVRPDWHAPLDSWAGDFAGKIVPFDSPDNPFRARNEKGDVEGYFLALGSTGVGLHSTHEPKSVGKLASHGCIRMRLADVRGLYRSIPLGTPVSITYELFRLERDGSTLRVRSFHDVYKRKNSDDREAMVRAHLRRHGINPDDLPRALISGAVTERDVSLSDADDFIGTARVNARVDASQKSTPVVGEEADLDTICRRLASDIRFTGQPY